MANIYDIARLAGVSPATVSRALNGYADVSSRTRDRVRRIVDGLGYRPSAIARGLVTNQSMLIGVFLRDHINSGFRHPFFQDVLASFKEVVGQEGYDLVFFSTDCPRAGYLTSDNVGGAMQAVNYLARNGHREIALIGVSHGGGKPGQDRLEGYQRALRAMFPPLDHHRTEPSRDG